ncbi:hypothetical protein V493_05366 [Pseudogymnoascus sp. VKM F-4281 (FW-2241)]|nr:hypothetical protein V493_05366 [Pseudogymnoascus sp. VKM F-4281 (FW-2241)]
MDLSRQPDGHNISQENAAPDHNADLDWKPRREENLIMMCLSLVTLIVALDATILVPALPIISHALNGNAVLTFWAGTSYLLTSAVFQPFLGALSDIFGRREILFLSLSLFTIGTLVCCTANNFTSLLAGRSIKGIGGGGIIAMVLVVLTDIVPLRQRPKYTSYVQVTLAFGTISGPLIGGAIVQHLTWRWLFYLSFPFCGIGLALIPFVVKLKKQKTTFINMFLHVDWLGSFLFIGSTTSFLIAITWGGVQFPWGSYQTLVPLLIGIAGCVVTVFWEKWGAKFPFVRLSIFKARSAYAAYFCAMTQGLLLYAELYYLSFYLQAIKFLSPIMNGIALLPITCGILPVSVLVGILITKFGRFRWSVWAGWIVSILATGLLCLLDVETSTVSYIFIFLTVGVGHGLLLSSLSFTVQAIASSQDVAYAAVLYAFVRGVGFCLGVALGGTVFQNFLARYLDMAGLPKSIASDAEGFVAVLKDLPGSQYKNDLLWAYATAFKSLFAILTGLSALGGMASLTISSHAMNKALDSEHMLRPVGLENIEGGLDNGEGRLGKGEGKETSGAVQ